MNTIVQFMKRHYKIVLLVLALSVGLWSCIPKDKNDPEKDKLLIELLTYVIEKGHYSPAQIDDTFSKGVYKDYITALDPSKRFFLQSDIDQFAQYETLIDNQIKNKDLTFFDLTYATYLKRMEESTKFYKDILSKPFDFSVKEELDTDYEKTPYAKNENELKEMKAKHENDLKDINNDLRDFKTETRSALQQINSMIMMAVIQKQKE